MAQQTIQDKQVEIGQKPIKALRPLRLPVFYAFAVAAVLGVVLEQIFFPNLRDNLGFLALFTFTTLFSLLSLGLSFSGLRARMPKAARTTVSVLVWGFAFLDLLFLILPSVLPGPTANDSAVNFAAASAPAPAQTTKAINSIASLTGTFNNQGDHAVAGKVTLGKTAEGKTVLRFESFNSANGPDLHVYLSKDANPASDAQVKNGIEAGKLKATQGNLNYELDGAIDLGQYKSVVVYCNSVSAIFGYANLTAS